MWTSVPPNFAFQLYSVASETPCLRAKSALSHADSSALQNSLASFQANWLFQENAKWWNFNPNVDLAKNWRLPMYHDAPHQGPGTGNRFENGEIQSRKAFAVVILYARIAIDLMEKVMRQSR